VVVVVFRVTQAGCQNRDREPGDSELGKSTVTTRPHSGIQATVGSTFQPPAARVAEGERGRGRSKKEMIVHPRP
jgi:hypothetical protein